MALTESELSAWWMPFTANRQFKSAPMLLARAEGMHYFTPEGRPVLDGASGLWCVNAGHGRKEIVEAVSAAISELDYAPPFKIGHPFAFRAADAVYRDTFDTGRHTVVSLEPRVVLADYDPADETLTVYHSGQAPYMLHDILSRHLRIPEHRVRVINKDVGGSFGLKIHTYPDEIATCAIRRDFPSRLREPATLRPLSLSAE